MTILYVLNGPEIGQSFSLQGDSNFIGRSVDNEIRIRDRTVSRKHLKITCRQGRYFATDLKSRNGTFYKGKYLGSGREVEIAEGEPLALGMTVICLSKRGEKEMAPFLDTVTQIKGTKKKGQAFKDRRKRPSEKREKLLSEVSHALKENVHLSVILANVLGHIFTHLKRIDRGAFVLVDPNTLRIREAICKLSKPEDATQASYSDEVVQSVLVSGKPLVYSKSFIQDGSGLVDTLEVLRIDSVMCVPLIAGSRYMGVMYLDSLERPDGFRKDDLLILLDIGQRVALAIETERFSLELLEIAETLSGEIQD